MKNNILKVDYIVENGWLITRVYVTDEDWFFDREGNPVFWENAKQVLITPDVYETRSPLTKIDK